MFVQMGNKTSTAACECGVEEQTVDHVVLQCPFHRPPHGLHGLMVLDDETTEWLLNTCPEIQCGQAVVGTAGSKEVSKCSVLPSSVTVIYIYIYMYIYLFCIYMVFWLALYNYNGLVVPRLSFYIV